MLGLALQSSHSSSLLFLQGQGFYCLFPYQRVPVLPAGMMLLVLPEVLHPPRCVTCHPGHVTGPPGLCSGVNPSVPLLGEEKQSPQFSLLAARRDLCTGRDPRNHRNTKNHLVPPPAKAGTPPTVPPHGWVGLSLDLVDSSNSSFPGHLHPHLQHLQWLLCSQKKILEQQSPGMCLRLLQTLSSPSQQWEFLFLEGPEAC